MEIFSPKLRYTVLCPEHLLFDVLNGTWFVGTIKASGHVNRANRPDTRPHLTNKNHFRNVLLIGSHPHWIKYGAVRRMRTRIELLAQPKSMHAIIGATQREQRHGLA